MDYTRLVSEQAVDVGHEGDASFAAIFLDEKAIQKRGACTPAHGRCAERPSAEGN